MSSGKTKFVTLKIFNVLGQVVETLVLKELAPNNYKFVWDASGFPSGVYFYRLQIKNFEQLKKMILLR